MTYEEMLASLFAARRFGVVFELSRVEAALAAVGDPHRRMGHVIHVGGTNGKGSTAAMIESILRTAGLKTGLYTSPHLSRFTERIRVGGVEVSRDALASRYVPSELTFFEQVTILAFRVFADEGVDAAVIEVGLGGRLDATNVVDPAVAVVTGVALDHQDVLGGTLEEIAREKAGIFKAGRPAVVGDGTLGPLAHAAGASPIVLATPYDGELGLAGEHQRLNAGCAAAAVRAAGLGSDEDIARGLAAARWPGRLERIGDVVLDAAHNPDGAARLAAWCRENLHDFAVVVGVSADKDLAGIVAPMAALTPHVFATRAPSPRAADPALLGVGTVEPDWWRAVEAARRVAPVVVVYGSLFLVGPVRARLLGEEVDPMVVTDPAAKSRVES